MVATHVLAHRAPMDTLACTQHTLCLPDPAFPHPLLHLRCRATSTVAALLTCRPDAGCYATRPSTAPTAGLPR